MDDVEVDFADLLVEEDELGHCQGVAFEELFWSFQGCPDERPEGSERAETELLREGTMTPPASVLPLAEEHEFPALLHEGDVPATEQADLDSLPPIMQGRLRHRTKTSPATTERRAPRRT